MKATCCYWSVVDGPYADMMQAVVDSARRVGVFKDFHIWCDRPIEGAECHELKGLEKSTYLFKLHFLRESVQRLDYDYFIWLDADTWFVRHPGDVLRVMQASPVHATLESDATGPDNRRPDWWGCDLPRYARLMRALGVKSRAIFNVNAGFWIVHHDAIETFCDLALRFWDLWCRDGHDPFSEEPPLAYAMHMLCGDPYRHTMRGTSELWASDWLGCYNEQLPDGRPWMFEDYFTGARCMVNPAIVHAMRCKDALVRRGRARIAP
jgi:hypothetical protein